MNIFVLKIILLLRFKCLSKRCENFVLCLTKLDFFLDWAKFATCTKVVENLPEKLIYNPDNDKQVDAVIEQVTVKSNIIEKKEFVYQ